MTKPKRPAAKRVRKPRNYGGTDFWLVWNNLGLGDFVEVGSRGVGGVLLAVDCRRLAAWLLRAAAWLEWKERK